MSAFGGKADMAVCGSPLSRSLLGVKRTCPLALNMSAYDPKRTLVAPSSARVFIVTMPVLGLAGEGNATTRVHYVSRRRGGNTVPGSSAAERAASADRCVNAVSDRQFG